MVQVPTRGQQPDGDVDVEDPRPGDVVGDPAADDRPASPARPASPSPTSPGQSGLRRRIALQQQRLRQRDHRPGDGALQHAEQQQRLERRRDPAEPRRDDEQQHAAVNSRTAPKRCVSQPVSGTAMALATAKLVMTQVPWLGETPRSPAIAGSATLAIDVSSTFMKTAPSDSATVPQNSCAPCSGGCAAGGGAPRAAAAGRRRRRPGARRQPAPAGPAQRPASAARVMAHDAARSAPLAVRGDGAIAPARAARSR